MRSRCLIPRNTPNALWNDGPKPSGICVFIQTLTNFLCQQLMFLANKVCNLVIKEFRIYLNYSL